METRTRTQYLHYKPNRSAPDSGVASSGMNPTKPSPGKFTEKEQMHGLNDRLAGFIEKVHHLEYQNHLLEREIGEIRGKAKPASSLEEECGPELRKLRQLVQDITQQKHRIEIEHQDLEEEVSKLRRQHEQEARSRSDAESNIVVLKRDINDAYQAKLQLDKKAQALVDEIHFLKRDHEAEVSEMCSQIRDAQGTARGAQEWGSPGVTAALRDIRAQLEGDAGSGAQQRQMGETFRSQFARLTEAAESKREALKASQQEIQEYRRRLQAKSIEMDCAKGTREALEKLLHDVEDRHKEEMIHYQNTIKELENELINCKFDMSGYLREYQDLLNVKMALDVEILSYRKLLCGEEARLSAMSDTHISLPYIYHQSPVYTLPCLSRPGGPHRRAEPQYKFVEEIITETTREIEMSEFEETGSEETEVEKDEQGCTKRDRGSSEEESDNKDGGEEEGEQECDGEQDQAVSGGDDGPKSEAGDEGENIEDKNTLSGVLLDEKHQNVAENTKEEKEAAATVQKDLSSKAHDLKPEVPKEDSLLKKSGDAKKEDAEKDGFISAQAKGPVDETSAQEGKTPELSSVQVQDEAPTSETAEKTADFTDGFISESEAGDKGENIEDKNTQSEVLLSESVDEKHQKVAENTKEEKEAAATVQKDLSSKAHDLKPEVPMEDSLLKKPGDAKKEDAEKDGEVVKEPVVETSVQEGKTQELSSVQVQDEAPTSETAEKTADFRESFISESEAGDEGENIEDKNTQSEVLLSESLDEKHQKVAENTKEEKEAVATVKKDLSSKAHDLKPEVPKEDSLLKKSGDAKKEDAEKDGFISAQAKGPVDETLVQEGKIQELSSVQVQNEAPTSETAEKTADFREGFISESEAGDKGENIEDKNTQSEVLLSESLDEKHQKVAENTKEKEAAATVQKDLSSKAHDLKPEVPKEDSLLKKPGDAKKEDAEKDGEVVKEPVDETSVQEGKTQEISSVQVQDEAPTSEKTAEKTADFTVEAKSSLSVKTGEISEKAQVSLSTTPKSEEKGNSQAQPKEISKSEDKVAQGSQDARPGQDKESSLKPDVKSLPEVKDQKPNSGDETQTVQTELPREKTTGIKELCQGAPEGSQAQKSKPSEVSEKIKEPEGKVEKVESSKK